MSVAEKSPPMWPTPAALTISSSPSSDMARGVDQQPQAFVPGQSAGDTPNRQCLASRQRHRGFVHFAEQDVVKRSFCAPSASWRSLAAASSEVSMRSATPSRAVNIRILARAASTGSSRNGNWSSFHGLAQPARLRLKRNSRVSTMWTDPTVMSSSQPRKLSLRSTSMSRFLRHAELHAAAEGLAAVHRMPEIDQDPDVAQADVFYRQQCSRPVENTMCVRGSLGLYSIANGRPRMGTGRCSHPLDRQAPRAGAGRLKRVVEAILTGPDLHVLNAELEPDFSGSGYYVEGSPADLRVRVRKGASKELATYRCQVLSPVPAGPLSPGRR